MDNERPVMTKAPRSLFSGAKTIKYVSTTVLIGKKRNSE